MNPGGKGANQAVAAARLEWKEWRLWQKWGVDIFGSQAVGQLKKEGIDCRYMLTDSAAASGVALITVDQRGENCIVVAPGANAGLSSEDVLAAQEAILRADIILVQLEIPLETVGRLVELASAAGKRVILNPAPARPLPDQLLSRLFIITPNEKEAESVDRYHCGRVPTRHCKRLKSLPRGVFLL